MNLFRKRYMQHRAHSRQRGIGFKLTFKEWKTMWLRSRHWHERGCRSDQFVMARKNDKGPYAIGNVKIVTAAQNHSERKLTKEGRDRQRRKTSYKLRGVPKSDEARASFRRAWIRRKANAGIA